MTDKAPEPTIADLPMRWDDHERSRYCPDCDEQLDVVALIHLVYSFESCSCDQYDFDHLVEQMWHRRCFVTAEEVK